MPYSRVIWSSFQNTYSGYAQNDSSHFATPCIFLISIFYTHTKKKEKKKKKKKKEKEIAIIVKL